MGMLFARRRKKVEGVTTTKNLIGKEPKKVESVQPQVEKSVPKQTTAQPKFKV
jgi:hypothetical protein